MIPALPTFQGLGWQPLAHPVFTSLAVISGAFQEPADTFWIVNWGPGRKYGRAQRTVIRARRHQQTIAE
jgi:hypothetical protein